MAFTLGSLISCEIQGPKSLTWLCAADIPDFLWESGERSSPPPHPPPSQRSTSWRSTGSDQEALSEPAGGVGEHPLPGQTKPECIYLGRRWEEWVAAGDRQPWPRRLTKSQGLGHFSGLTHRHLGFSLDFLSLYLKGCGYGRKFISGSPVKVSGYGMCLTPLPAT